jgi:hypothetical protein
MLSAPAPVVSVVERANPPPGEGLQSHEDTLVNTLESARDLAALVGKIGY